LLDEVPANLILGQVVSGSRGRGFGGSGDNGSYFWLDWGFLVLILKGEVTVGGHNGDVILRSAWRKVEEWRKLEHCASAGGGERSRGSGFGRDEEETKETGSSRVSYCSTRDGRGRIRSKYGGEEEA
jgi:hypothetical protein